MTMKPYRLRTISNGDRKRLAAKEHNDLLVEREAYIEDRARDPEKYERRVTAKDKADRRMVVTMVAIAAGTMAK